MPGLVTGIHVLGGKGKKKSWMAGTSPAMTAKMSTAARDNVHQLLHHLGHGFAAGGRIGIAAEILGA